MYSLVNLKKYFGKNRFDAFPFEKKVSDVLTDEVGKVYTLPLPTCTSVHASIFPGWSKGPAVLPDYYL